MILVHYFLLAFHNKSKIAMKTKAKTKTKGATHRKATGSRKANGPGKSIENRDLNEDEQNQITNAGKDNDLAPAPDNSIRNTDFTVEEEEEREKRRKVEESRPEEPTK